VLLTTVGLLVEIEIYSDVVCPWCYLGQARLDAALASYDGEVTLRWRAFQLDPDTPHECQPVLDYIGRRLGGAERARQAVAHVSGLAAAEGLHLDFDRALIANTFDAHRLLWFADQPETVVFGAGPDTQQELADALHRAHFAEGRDIGSFETLVDIATELGLDPERVGQFLVSNEGTADVRAQIAHAHDVGITSVPTFVFAGKYAVTGAQETATLRAVLDEVSRREGMTPTLRSLIPNQRTTAAHEDDASIA
jgi:predicted DsbA family dithiol-disulfide isomerase